MVSIRIFYRICLNLYAVHVTSNQSIKEDKWCNTGMCARIQTVCMHIKITNDRFIERNINVAKVNWQNSIINVCIHHRMNEITSEQDWFHSPSGVTGWFIRAQTSEVYVTGIVSHPEPKPSPSSFVDPVQILSPPQNPFKLTRFCYRAISQCGLRYRSHLFPNILQNHPCQGNLKGHSVADGVWYLLKT